jgi:muramoyltetrapeptide carboxypeptidase LdcA involved in peptidoglycan recycling
MIAARLQRGDEVRIVSPAVSLEFIPEDQQLTARERLEEIVASKVCGA